ncbi:type VII secretion target [Kineosporia sp. NBRC 101731]|uniref:type VII secretion target n=1 Tax=Kineosporia sp. NBRC 101731 TaxID=3032199 RepID=UPI0024A45B32|nr:type VII secretion target [Kineosporia sp. NBRC 101731]GLY28105.1 hypothetical protein Kisp02_14700 [Kineosporia sp. NBRC 101731]
MTENFEVSVSDLRVCARQAETAASVVGKLDPGADLTSASHEIPGADSVAALTQVASKWDSDLKLWRDTMQEFSEGLDSAATGYESSDEAGAQAYAALSPEYGLVPEGSAALDLNSRPPSAYGLNPDVPDLDLSVLKRGNE